MKKKKGILQWFRNQKLGKKIMYTFVFAAVIPLLAVQMVMLYVISNNMKAKVDALMVSQLVQISERTSLTLNVYTNLVYQIYSDNQVIEALGVYGEEDSGRKARAYREISERIQQYGISTSGIECISIILPDGEDITYDFGLASGVDNLWEEYADKTAIAPYVRAEEETNMAILPTERFVREGEEARIFHIAKRMYDFKAIQKGSIGTVIMSINESVLQDVCNTAREEEAEIYAVHFIADSKGNVLTYPNSFYSGIRMDPDKTVTEFVEVTGELAGKNCAVNQYWDEQLEWTFYNAYDKNYMMRDVRHVQYLTVIIGCILFFVSVLLIRYTVRLIERSTNSIIGGIQQVQQGNLDVRVLVDCEDEMGQIADNFNTMTEKVRKLIEEVKEALEKQKNAEIRALEAQINPHFLYNTLDSINWMAIEKGEYEISKMLRNLGVILRYSISKSNQMVDVLEMADWLDKYVSLQQMRFNDSFSFELHVDEEAKQIRIHKLLIQPFVENAIIHGFKGIESGGILRVDVMLSEQAEELDIIIEDNGKGMPEEFVQKCNDYGDSVRDDFGNIGLNNAFSRMRMYYGEAVSWDVSSIPDVGTIITLKIPAEYRERKEKT